MKKKSFLFIPETYPSGLTGTSVKTRSTIQFLLNKGHSVDVACIQFKTLVKKELKHKNLSIFTVYRDGIRKIRLSLINRLFSLVFSTKPTRVNRIFDQRLQTVVDILQFSKNYDYILFDGFSTLQYARKYQKNYIYIDDEDITMLIKKRMAETQNIALKLFLFIEYRRCLLFEKEKLSFMAQIWGISFGSLQRLKTLTKAKPFLMPTVVTQKPNIFNEEAKNIVFTGTLSWSENYIGLRWFIQNCWDTIHKKHPKTKLFVVGQQADNSWNKLIQKHTNIELLGYVEKLEDVYKNCALAISPVFINVGIKIKVLTYLSYGLPVLATKASLGGMKSGKGIIAASKKNFVEQADILLSNSSVRKKISKDSQENIRINHSNKTLNDFFLKTKVFS